MSDPIPRPPAAAEFPMTRWSLVAAAADRPADRQAPAAREALSELCNAYWFPIYAFIRRKGHDPDESFDLTQDYFTRLLAKHTLAAADRGKGRFRAFLRTDCGRFLADRRDRERAAKRGGGVAPLSIDARDAEGRYRHEPADAMTPERLFDRAWTLALLDEVFAEIGREYADSDRGPLFLRLKDSLLDDEPLPYAAVGAALGMAESAVQSAMQRLRKRFREVIRARVAATLETSGAADIDDEIRALFATLVG